MTWRTLRSCLLLTATSMTLPVMTHAGWHSFAPGTPLAESWVKTIAEDSTGTLWFGIGSGEVSFNGTIWTLHAESGFGGPRDIAFDRSGAMWVTTADYVERVSNGRARYFDGHDG